MNIEQLNARVVLWRGQNNLVPKEVIPSTLTIISNWKKRVMFAKKATTRLDNPVKNQMHRIKKTTF
jgi:hypothetical protein